MNFSKNHLQTFPSFHIDRLADRKLNGRFSEPPQRFYLFLDPLVRTLVVSTAANEFANQLLAILGRDRFEPAHENADPLIRRGFYLQRQQLVRLLARYQVQQPRAVFAEPARSPSID